MTTLAVTGHRPPKLGGFGPATKARLTGFAYHCLQAYDPDLVYTGMALGWDQAVAVACHQLDIPFVACVPFAGQEAMWQMADQKEYRRLLTKAEKIHIVSKGGYHSKKMMDRNRWMVDNTEELLALWDGEPNGGTWQCVQYAERQNKPVHALWQKYTKFQLLSANE